MKRVVCVVFFLFVVSFLHGELFIVPGEGFGPIKLGMQYPEVVKILGEPQKNHSHFGERSARITYPEEKVSVCFVRSEEKGLYVREIQFRKGCLFTTKGRTAYVGASEAKIFHEFGEPKEVVILPKIKDYTPPKEYGVQYKVENHPDQYSNIKYPEGIMFQFLKGEVYMIVISISKKDLWEQRHKRPFPENNKDKEEEDKVITHNIKVTCPIKDAVVFVDGEEVGKVNDELEVEEGTHIITIAKHGFVDINLKEKIEEDQEFEVKFRKRGLSLSLSTLFNGKNIHDWSLNKWGKWEIKDECLFYRPNNPRSSAMASTFIKMSENFYAEALVKVYGVDDLRMLIGSGSVSRRQSSSLPDGKWCKLTTIAKGDKIRVYLNGRVVNDVHRGYSNRLKIVAGFRESARKHAIIIKEVRFTPLDKKTASRLLKGARVRWR